MTNKTVIVQMEREIAAMETRHAGERYELTMRHTMERYELQMGFATQRYEMEMGETK